MDRRRFIRNVAASGAVVFLGGSVLGRARADDDPKTCSRGVTATVSQDPHHELVVSREDIIAGVAKTYHVQGTSGHDHLVTLTADDFASLAAGNEIEEKTTITLLHRHTVSVKCA
jgi:hypothetical protein